MFRGVFAVAVCFLASAAGCSGDQKEVAKELESLQGKWTQVYHETEGVVDTEECKWELEVRGTQYTIHKGGKAIDKGTLKLDPSKTPKQLEYTNPPFGEIKETNTYIGIYVIDGDTYKTCDVEKGRTRPTDFKAKEKTGQVSEWKRIK